MNYFKILCIAVLLIGVWMVTSLIPEEQPPQEQDIEQSINSSNLPPALKMYFSLLHYSEKYNVPKKYAFAIAYAETGYRGPFHWDYNPAQISSANAMGPMQIMPSTANWLAKEQISHKELKTNIPLNVELSMQLVSQLKKKYKDWKIVFGYYNTGYPIVNEYAIKVSKGHYIWDKVK